MANRERHSENVERLERIEEEAKTTNGRVTRHDEQLRTLFAWKKAAGDLLTIPRLRWYLLAVGAGFAGALWLMSMLGWHR